MYLDEEDAKAQLQKAADKAAKAAAAKPEDEKLAAAAEALPGCKGRCRRHKDPGDL